MTALARLLTTAEAATYLGVSQRFFEGTLAAKFPVIDVAPVGRKRRAPRYDREDLAAWIRDQKGAA